MAHTDTIIARKILSSDLALNIVYPPIRKLKEAAEEYELRDKDDWKWWHIDFRDEGVSCTMIISNHYITGLQVKVDWPALGQVDAPAAARKLKFMSRVAALGEEIIKGSA